MAEIKNPYQQGFAFLAGRKAMQGAQEFDKDNIFITKNGEKINVYQMIQNNREDTEIEPTLKKYGCLTPMEMNIEQVYTDLTNIKGDMRDMIEQQQEADNLWNKLPRDVRETFGNSKRNFLENGETWLKSKIEKAKAEAEKLKQEQNPTPAEPTTGALKNE